MVVFDFIVSGPRPQPHSHCIGGYKIMNWMEINFKIEFFEQCFLVALVYLMLLQTWVKSACTKDKGVLLRNEYNLKQTQK